MKIFRTRAFADLLKHAASLIPHVRTIREARGGIGFTNRLILQRRYTLSPTTANEPSFNLQSPFYSTLISSIFQTFFPRQKVSQPCKKTKENTADFCWGNATQTDKRRKAALGKTLTETLSILLTTFYFFDMIIRLLTV